MRGTSGDALRLGFVFAWSLCFSRVLSFYVECSNFLQKKELLCSSLYHNPSPSKVPIRPDYGPTPVRRVINHDAEPNTSNMSVAHIGKSNPGIDENRHRFFFPGIN